MHHSIRALLAGFLLSVLPPAAWSAAPPPTPPVTVVVDTTLTTWPGQIRQFAFDGDPGTYFASAKNAGKSDHFTLVFDDPVTVTSIAAVTGRPGGEDKLIQGALEVSSDGKTFSQVAKFAGGAVRWKSSGRTVRAIRIQPTADLKHPLTIREIAVESHPRVAVFTYPVEFIVNVDDAPEMKDWADKVARLCERWYARINEELKSEGFTPPRVVRMTLTKRYDGVAYASGSRITGAVQYFKNNPKDVGAMIHETAHVVQQYRRGNNPGWLVEGIADYVRFFKYEPGNLGRLARRPRYNGSYRTTAAFLGYLTAQYDRDIVRKLNKVMREGEYKEEVFKKLTGKTVQQLGEEWRDSLRR